MRSADTILAVSSPPGRSRRGLIRVAGPAARGVAGRLVDGGEALPARRMTATRLRAEALPGVAALAAWFEAPHSYCGDDTLELQVPGHPALLERVLRVGLGVAGVRLAEPGEFTFRAFAAGKLDLLEAEAIAATIAARGDRALAAAAALRDGPLGRLARAAVEELATLLALVEAGIDFTDQEDVVPIPPGRLSSRVGGLRDNLEALLRRARAWGAVEALPRVVLAGPPSAGKSTLFNALLGKQRAVIDPQPGTTRDVLEAPLTLPDGSEVLLVDLAGLDNATAPLDQEAQRLAREAIARADVVLALGAWRPPPTGDAAVLTLHSRCDLDASPTPASPRRRAQSGPGVQKAALDRGHHPAALRVSGLTGEGLDGLRGAIAQALGRRDDSSTGETLALQPRHTGALRNAIAALEDALGFIDADAAALARPELVALGLRSALDTLGGLGGTMTPDDVIGRVFAVFCVGK